MMEKGGRRIKEEVSEGEKRCWRKVEKKGEDREDRCNNRRSWRRKNEGESEGKKEKWGRVVRKYGKWRRVDLECNNTIQ